MSIWSKIDVEFHGLAALTEAERETLQWFSSEPSDRGVFVSGDVIMIDYQARSCDASDDPEIIAWFTSVAARCTSADLAAIRTDGIVPDDRYAPLYLRMRDGQVERGTVTWESL